MKQPSNLFKVAFLFFLFTAFLLQSSPQTEKKVRAAPAAQQKVTAVRAVAPPAVIEGNDIIGFHIISETPRQIVMEVMYNYSGNFGKNVFMGAEMAKDGESSPFYATGPGKVMVGHHQVRVTLTVSQNAPPEFDSNQILLRMYIGASYVFLQELFPHHKVWVKSGLKGIAPEDIPGKGLRFRIIPDRARRGQEVELLLSRPVQNVMVFYGDRPLPKKTMEGGRVIVVTVPGDAMKGRHFEIEWRGRRYRAVNPFYIID